MTKRELIEAINATPDDATIEVLYAAGKVGRCTVDSIDAAYGDANRIVLLTQGAAELKARLEAMPNYTFN